MAVSILEERTQRHQYRFGRQCGVGVRCYGGYGVRTECDERLWQLGRAHVL